MPANAAPVIVAGAEGFGFNAAFDLFGKAQEAVYVSLDSPTAQLLYPGFNSRSAAADHHVQPHTLLVFSVKRAERHRVGGQLDALANAVLEETVLGRLVVRNEVLLVNHVNVALERQVGRSRLHEEFPLDLPRLQNLARLQRSQPSGLLQLSAAIVQEVVRVGQDVGMPQAEHVRCGLEHFLRFTGDITLDRIDSDMLDKYQRKRLAEVSQRTARGELNYVLRLLRLRGFLVARPLPRPGRVTQQRRFTQDEIERFFRACPPRYKTLHLLMLATGARQAELVPSTAARSSHVALLKSEVDLAQRRITIRTAQMKPGSEPRERIVPIPEELVEPLREQMRLVEGPHVFRRYVSSRRDFDAILRRAGIPKIDELRRKVTSHSFRHTYATLMAEAVGDNQFLLMKILGHSQISTTARYCHPAAPLVGIDLGVWG